MAERSTKERQEIEQETGDVQVSFPRVHELMEYVSDHIHHSLLQIAHIMRQLLRNITNKVRSETSEILNEAVNDGVTAIDEAEADEGNTLILGNELGQPHARLQNTDICAAALRGMLYGFGPLGAMLDKLIERKEGRTVHAVLAETTMAVDAILLQQEVDADKLEKLADEVEDIAAEFKSKRGEFDVDGHTDSPEFQSVSSQQKGLVPHLRRFVPSASQMPRLVFDRLSSARGDKTTDVLSVNDDFLLAIPWVNENGETECHSMVLDDGFPRVQLFERHPFEVFDFGSLKGISDEDPRNRIAATVQPAVIRPSRRESHFQIRFSSLYRELGVLPPESSWRDDNRQQVALFAAGDILELWRGEHWQEKNRDTFRLLRDPKAYGKMLDGLAERSTSGRDTA